MKRRNALKYMMMATATAVVLPSCVFDKKKSEGSGKFSKLPISGDDEKNLTLVTETIIPETDILGSKTLKADAFVLTMVNDCYDEKSQQAFMKGLSQIDELADKRFKKSFEDCTNSEREELLTSFENKDTNSEEVFEFYKIARRHTIQAFMSSEFVMTKYQGYEYLPGRFNGCVDLTSKKIAS